MVSGVQKTAPLLTSEQMVYRHQVHVDAPINDVTEVKSDETQNSQRKIEHKKFILALSLSINPLRL